MPPARLFALMTLLKLRRTNETGQGMLGRVSQWAKITFDAIGITHANLNVIMLPESGVRIELPAFPKNTTNAIVSGQICVLG